MSAIFVQSTLSRQLRITLVCFFTYMASAIDQKTNRSRIITTWVMLGLFTIGHGPRLVMAAPARTKFRNYDKGPLRIEEFRGKPVPSSGGNAFTSCSVEFSLNYSVHTQYGEFTATLTSFNAYAVFFPHKSWWTKRAAPALLDHEQGHFDIAEMTARRLEYTFMTALANSRKIQATGNTREESVKRLRRKLQSVIDVANEQAAQDNRDYDAMTLHGTRYGRQAEFRRVQKATLKRLAEKTTAVKKAR